jgi:diguanylate cyclase
MLNSIYRKLILLVSATVVLIALIMFSMWSLLQQQKQAQIDLENIIEIHLSVDQLRSQLWVFLQHSDNQSLNEVFLAQKSLSNKLAAMPNMVANINNINKMNQSLAILLEKEKSMAQQAPNDDHIPPQINRPESLTLTSNDLLHSRYNMLAQSMTEELFYLQQRILNRSANTQNLTLISSALQLIIFSFLVSAIAWLILQRFKRGVRALQVAIQRLASGHLNSKVTQKNLDSEFLDIAAFFNRMTESLRNTTVTRDELKKEVQRQTEVLSKQKEDFLFLSQHDHLTGLMNRRAFEQTLENAIIKANRSNSSIALLFIDLDRFKQVNDTLGHDAGDEILRQVAKRLRENIRESDFIGRLGGDEFVVCLDLLTDINSAEKKAHQIINDIEQPITFAEHCLLIQASIGISYFPLQTRDLRSLVRIADEAMYRAKKISGSAVVTDIGERGPLQNPNA